MIHRDGGLTPRGAERGFTLIEMLLVLLVTGVLATLILPNYRTSQLKAQAADVLTRIEAINIAVKAYEADHQMMPVVAGPVGSPPAFLASYMQANHFAGPAAITFQLNKTAGDAAPTLLITANGEAEQQILLATAATLGNSAFTLGGGASIGVTLTD